MRELMHIKEAVCEEAIRLTKNGVNPSDLEPLYYMIEIIKGVLKIHVLEEEMDGGYSGRGRYSMDVYPGDYRDGGYSGKRDRYGRYSRDGGAYDRGESYDRRGEHYVRGHYSREDGSEHMKMELERLMEESSDPKVRESIKRIMKQMDD